MEAAEEMARKTLPPGVFDSLPEIVKQAMIQSQHTILEMEERDRKLKARDERGRLIYNIDGEKIKYPDPEFLRTMRVSDRVGPGYGKKQHFVPISFEKSTEFPDDEPNPTSHAGGLVRGFRKDTILGYKDLVVEKYREAYSHDDVIRTANAYFMFTIWIGNKRMVGTKAIALHDDDYEDDVRLLYEAWYELIEKIEDAKNGYESIFEGNIIQTHLKVVIKYYPSPKSVSYWGNVKPIENFDYFDIFTASEDQDCVMQVINRLYGEYTHIQSLNDLINQKDVCILGIHHSIKNIKDIKDYSDFYILPESKIKLLSTLDPNIKYIIHHKEHVGILENMKEQRRVRYYTKFRPLMKYPKCQKITVCFDIECYFDPDNDQRHVPYLCCACFVYDDEPGNVMEFEGKDCVAQMLDYCCDVAQDFEHTNIELIAHNGGGYDFHYILTSMHDPSIVKNILIRNNHFISFRFKHLDVNFSVKDSLNFLGCSLANAAKSFLSSSEYKTDFPHHEVRTADDLQRTFNEWISVDQHINVNVEKERMLITSKHIINYESNNNTKKLIDWAKEYCCNDVIVLAKVWIAFKKTIKEIFGAHVVDQTYTLAGMSFRLFEAHLPTGIKLYHPKKEDFINMRSSLIGGRCVSMNGIYDNVACLDVKSLYPAAMAYYDQPYGNYRKVTEKIDNELGIYYCKVKPQVTHTTQSSPNHGFFPLKSKGDVKYNGVQEEYKAWYTSVDMAIGREEGHAIEVIPFEDDYVGYSWKNKALIFKDYIEGVLYKLKNDYEKEGNKEKRHAIKIIMNSLWGKFAQKWMDTSYKILHENDIDLTIQDGYKIFDTNFMMSKKYKDHDQSDKPVQNGVFVLSWARHHMKKCWKAIAKDNAVCLYSDTDSIFVDNTMIDYEAMMSLNQRHVKVIGNEMGQLEVEAIFDELICVGKKQYIGKYGDPNNPKYKKRFKGVPLNYIKPELYGHLIKNPSYTAKIQFLKFKREWGMVKGYMESKTVRAT